MPDSVVQYRAVAGSFSRSGKADLEKQQVYNPFAASLGQEV